MKQITPSLQAFAKSGTLPLLHCRMNAPVHYLLPLKTLKLLLSSFFLFSLQPLVSQTVSVTATGSFGISCSEYVNHMNRTWDITIADGGILM